jgi:putative FmdB family regulatory protein
MPVYEYKCEACGTRFPLTQPRNKRGAPAACPKCKNLTRKRLFTTGGLLKSRGKDRKDKSTSRNRVGRFTFVDCESSFNKKGGFLFRGGVEAELLNAKLSGNPRGIVVRDGAQVTDHNTQFS